MIFNVPATIVAVVDNNGQATEVAVADSDGIAMTEDIVVADSSGRAIEVVAADNNGRAMTEDVATPTHNRLLHSGIDWLIAMSGQTSIGIAATLAVNSEIADVAVGGNTPSH